MNKTFMNIKNTIKQLELQVDSLIGYRPTGHPWKHEYILRRSLIDRLEAKGGVEAKKLMKLQKKLHILYGNLEYRQGYMYYCQQEHQKPKEEKKPIKIIEWDGEKYKETIV